MGEKRYHVLEELVNIIGPSGFEKGVQEYFSKIMKPFVDNVYSDKVGNCYAEIFGNPKLPKLMFNAHADTVGFMIKYIDDKGFVFTEDLTGYPELDYTMLPGTPVMLLGRKSGKMIDGDFIPTIPCHKLSSEDIQISIDREDLAIDIGAASSDEARQYVDIGDYVVLKSVSKYRKIGNNHHFIGTNLDDRIGLFCMYTIAKELRKSKLKDKCPLIFVSTVNEEGAPQAARVAAITAKPDISITIDTSVATDSIRQNDEETTAKRYGILGLDKGISVTRGRGVVDDLFSYLEDLCKGKNGKGAIPYQIELAGYVGTENVDMQVAGTGTKTALVSIPTRNLHTSIETISLVDVENAICLCKDLYEGISRKEFS